MQEIKRIKRDPVPRLNKKSNEDQFKANKAVTEAVEDAQAALRTKDREITKEALDRGMALLPERQKLILFADKSLYGWKTEFECKHHHHHHNNNDNGLLTVYPPSGSSPVKNYNIKKEKLYYAAKIKLN